MTLPPIIRLLRPKQWIKNGFVAAPLFFTPDKVTTASLLDVLAGFAVLCMAASAVYCLNDLRDAEGDRNHPVKKDRPIASGAISPATAMVLMVLLLAGGVALAAWRVPVILWVVGAYFAINIAYTVRLKHIAILDVLIVAFGFVLRVEAGALIIDTEPSAWILIVTGLLALFIALAKRRDDIVRDLDADHRKSLDGYSLPFLDGCLMAVLSTLLVSYLIFTTDQSVMARLGSEKLYFTGPFVIAGVLRYLQLTIVYERSGSPTDLVYRDHGLQLSVAGWLATFVWLLYL
ncbi:MAG: UbiA prenyltransferase family protein [Proteobacteria bacterium]|nr:UbiA prenyltransferase family protein [Pseudomonadota bacterium]MCK4868928.1 UbiA prenyltransferase family protein [Alphaproteobacteria bacterium]